MPAAIPKNEIISFWTSVRQGAPLLFLLLVDMISIAKPTKEVSNLFLDSETYRILVFGGIYVLSVWIIYLRRMDFYQVMRGHWLYILFLIYAFSSILWSTYPAKAFITSGHLIGHYLVVVSGLLLFRGYEVSLVRVYCMFSYIFIPACLVTAFFFPDRNIHDAFGRWRGLTSNPNSLGAACMICVWANISYFFYARKTLIRLWTVSMLVGAFVLLKGAGSVTSLALSAVALISVPLFYWFANSRNLVIALFKISYSSLIIFGVFAYFYATQPDLFDANRALGTVGRDSNLTGRATLWAIAWRAIAEQPWLGWSFDALSSLPTRYSINYNQFHNGYLDIMVRGGMIALSFIIIFAITTTVRIVRIAASNKALAASFGALLMLIMLHNISEASFAQTPNPLWLLFSFVFVGISPHIVRWYETGELEVKKVEMAREVKPTAEPAEVTAIQSHSSLHRSPTSSSRVGA